MVGEVDDMHPGIQPGFHADGGIIDHHAALRREPHLLGGEAIEAWVRFPDAQGVGTEDMTVKEARQPGGIQRQAYLAFRPVGDHAAWVAGELRQCLRHAGHGREASRHQVLEGGTHAGLHLIQPLGGQRAMMCLEFRDDAAKTYAPEMIQIPGGREGQAVAG